MNLSDTQEPRRITMQHLANHLGVAKSTVARALAGSDRVSESTRKQVRALAEELGYRPDPALSRIAEARWKSSSPSGSWTLAILQSKPMRGWKASRLAEAAHAAGFEFDALDLREFDSAGELERVLTARGIRGLLIEALPDPALQGLLEFDWRPFSVLCCGFGRVRLPFDVVRFHHFENSRRAWRYLEEAGCRRIAALLHRHDPIAEDDIGRESAVLFELDQRPRRRRIPLKRVNHARQPELAEWVRRWEADGVIAFPGAIGSVLRKAGIRIPHEVRIVSLHGSTPEAFPYVDCDAGFLYEEALKTLIARVRSGQRGIPEHPREILLEGIWRERSTPARP